MRDGQADTIVCTGDTHDLMHVRDEAGWRFERSAYPELKLSPTWMRDRLGANGLSVTHEETVRGMTVVAARR